MYRSLGFLLVLSCTSPIHAELAIGDVAPKITFKDIRYLTRSLDDLPRSKAYVLVFLNTSCPLVERYLPELARLEQLYRDRGVQFLGVNVGPEDSIRAMATQAIEFQIAFPVVKDRDASCATRLGVQRTPEVVVLDGGRKLRYRGRIDDQYRIGGARPAPTRRDLARALDDLLAGKAVEVAETTVDGCLITRSKTTAPGTGLTYARDVAPILARHCVECHRPGTAAPFTLVSYEQVTNKARAIAEVVREEQMPPWYASPKHTGFANQRGMTSRERERLLSWLAGDQARGEDAGLPPVPGVDPGAWRIGKPSLILRAPEHELPADGLIDYKYIVLPYLFTSDTWVQGVEIRGDNPRVLHHCNMAYVRLGESFQMSNFITGTVPGGEAMTLDRGVAYRIPSGSFLILQVHYVTTGKKEKCRLSVGLKYASGKVDQHLRFTLLVDKKFAIPPGVPAHKVTASRKLPEDAVGVAMFSHMHVRGRDMTFRAHYPDGKSETLLTIPNYNFDWQMAYRWHPGTKKFPRGTRLEAIAHYDNSSFNPFNPDPKATVRDGQQTHQEMMNGFVFYVHEHEKLGLHIDGSTGHVKR